MKDEKRFDWKKLLWAGLLALLVFLCVTFVSECSFCYRMNEWDDVNCFHTVAMAMKEGKVLYRDIYEQKGLYLYALHILAISISNGTYFGIYLFELIAGWTFAFFTFKTLRLFGLSYRRSILGAMPILLGYYISIAFWLGDSVEEYALPMYAFSLYILLKKAKQGSDIPFYQIFISGALCGALFLAKFTLVAFYVGFGILVFVWEIKDKKVLRGFIDAITFILGFLLACLPCLLYFGLNGAMNELFTVYFYNNLFYYSDHGSPNLFLQFLISIGVFFAHTGFGWPYFLMILFGFIYFTFTKKDFHNRVYSAILTLFIVISVCLILGRVHYTYYGLPYAAFAFVGVLAVHDLSLRYKGFGAFVERHKKFLGTASIALMMILSFAGSPNIPVMFKSKEDMVQFKMKEIILQEENPTILNYGFLDGGLYYLCQSVPECKYFCGLNSNDPAIEETQQQFIDEGKVTFVIAVNEEPKNIALHYVLIFNEVYSVRYETREYLLYKKIA